KSMDWHNQANPDIFMTASTTSGSITNVVLSNSGARETWDLCNAGFLLKQNETFSLGNQVNGVSGDGYSIAALRFDVIDVTGIGAPSGLSATTDGGKIDLNWNDDASGLLDFYSVYRSTIQGSGYLQIASNLTASNYSDPNVTPGSTYYYVVTATDTDNSESDFSAETAVLAVIQAPSNLKATPDEELVSLDWDDNNSSIFDFFTVYRSETMGAGFEEIATGLTASSYFDFEVTNGTTYYYIVTATDNGSPAVESGQSGEVKATPFEYVIGSELYVHLDATDADSVTTTPDNNVILWADQTANELNAVSNGGNVFYPSTSLSASGLPGLDMGPLRNTLTLFDAAGQGRWLDFTDGAGALPYSGFAVFVALKADSILGGISREVVMANFGNVEANTFVLKYEGGRPQLVLGGQIVGLGGPIVNAGDTVILAMNYDAALGNLEFWDSLNDASATASVPPANFSKNGLMYLGGSPNGDQKMDGMIGEVKIYRGMMTATEFANERQALVSKWVGSSADLVLGQWRMDNFGSSANSGIGADEANPDSDALVNLLEFAFGLDPNLVDARPVTWNGTTATRGVPALQNNGPSPRFLFTRRVDLVAADSADYEVQFSSDLTDWETFSEVNPTVLANLTDVELVSVTLPSILGNGKTPKFARLIFNLAP
ncbi:hypothetical protein N9A94_07170, partial [Akkermansiaceae bacterium]|nr:hypothetical protein [Akkermansiaceae bacterium]